jgi:alkylation response protein AidB-like acyl-CoA dehydrogenase
MDDGRGDEPGAAAVRAQLRAWLAEQGDADAEPRAWLERLVDSGWAAPTWPVAWYGRGLSPPTAVVVEEELAARGATGGNQDKANLWANTLLAYGTDELRARFLRPLLLGDVPMCLLYSEPGAGSDLASVQTQAERDGAEWVVNGQKVWTSGGRHAHYGLLIARTDWDAPKHRGISFFFFPMQQPGVEVRPLRQATGDARFNEVFLTDARVPDAHRLGEVNGGWWVLQTALMYERAAMGASRRRHRSPGDDPTPHALGGPERGADDEAPAPAPDLSLVARARTLGRADDRRLRQAIAHLHCLRTVNEWNGRRARAEMEQGSSSPAASLGKLAMSGVLHTAARLQASILGADAMLAGPGHEVAADCTYALLNAYFTSIGGGTDQIQRNIIGERILGLPKEPEVDKALPFRQVRTSPVAGQPR